MKRGAEGSVVVRRNPGYNPALTKEWLVLNAGTCVGEFDKESEANAHRDSVVEELPKRADSGLSYQQQLQYAYKSTPKKEVKKRRELRAELELIKAQEAQVKEKTKTKRVKKEKSPLTEAFEVLLPKKRKGHYHKGRRGCCSCEKGADNG